MVAATVEPEQAVKNRHAAMIAKVCLATGARWSEAESLEVRHIRNSQIQFAAGTKSGKVRYAHLAPDHLQEVVKLNPLTALTVR